MQWAKIVVYNFTDVGAVAADETDACLAQL